MYTPGTTTNSQREPIKINKNGAVAKNFSGTSNTIKHFKTFGIISNELRISLPF